MPLFIEKKQRTEMRYIKMRYIFVYNIIIIRFLIQFLMIDIQMHPPFLTGREK